MYVCLLNHFQTPPRLCISSITCSYHEIPDMVQPIFLKIKLGVLRLEFHKYLQWLEAYRKTVKSNFCSSFKRQLPSISKQNIDIFNAYFLILFRIRIYSKVNL